jgi:hypothetical protein
VEVGVTKDEVYRHHLDELRDYRELRRTDRLFWMKSDAYAGENRWNSYKQARLRSFCGLSDFIARRCPVIEADSGERCTMVAGHPNRWHSLHGYLNWTARP